MEQPGCSRDPRETPDPVSSRTSKPAGSAATPRGPTPPRHSSAAPTPTHNRPESAPLTTTPPAPHPQPTQECTSDHHTPTPTPQPTRKSPSAHHTPCPPNNRPESALLPTTPPLPPHDRPESAPLATTPPAPTHNRPKSASLAITPPPPPHNGPESALVAASTGVPPSSMGPAPSTVPVDDATTGGSVPGTLGRVSHTMRSAVPPGWDRTRPFTRAQGLAAGLSDAELRRDCRPLHRGVYVARDVPLTLTVRAQGALLASPPGAVLSHHTAAALWGGIVPASTDIHVRIAQALHVRRPGIHAHRSDHPVPVGRRHGLALTAPAKTFRDLGDHLDLTDLVVLGDSLVAARVTTPAALIAQSRTGGGHGAVRCRQAAGLVRAGVESPMESRLRVLIVRAGLPEPVVNHEVTDDRGRVRYRIDLSYPEHRIAIEYDGAYHDAEVQHGADLVRREDLEAEGWRFVIVVSRDFHRDPGQVVARVVRVMASAGMPLPRAWR